MASNLIAMASKPNCNGLQPNSDGLQSDSWIARVYTLVQLVRIGEKMLIAARSVFLCLFTIQTSSAASFPFWCLVTSVTLAFSGTLPAAFPDSRHSACHPWLQAKPKTTSHKLSTHKVPVLFTFLFSRWPDGSVRQSSGAPKSSILSILVIPYGTSAQ